MAENKTKTEAAKDPKVEETPVASNSIPEPVLPEIVAQKAKTVGDENIQVREPTADSVVGTVPAQVAGKPEDSSKVVPVHEVYVATDTVITDTSHPLAVQVPDAGRGDASLPIHQLANGTVEQRFAVAAGSGETQQV